MSIRTSLKSRFIGSPIISNRIELLNGNFIFYLQIARTEHIKNNLNPDFATPIQMVYTFEVVQKLKFKVFDVDNATTSLDDDDFLGELTCNLGNVSEHILYPSILLCNIVCKCTCDQYTISSYCTIDSL